MDPDGSAARLLNALSGGLTVPGLAKLGAAVIAFGLVFDLSEHSFVSHANDQVIGGFPVAEHLAHFVVLVGMVLVLVGIVADGLRAQRRHSRQKGSSPDALR